MEDLTTVLHTTRQNLSTIGSDRANHKCDSGLHLWLANILVNQNFQFEVFLLINFVKRMSRDEKYLM